MDFTWSIDMTIVIGFLLLTLFVGLGHGQKNKNIKDYALGGRNFSTGALVATLVATYMSGSGFFIDLSNTFSDGLPYIIASSGMALSFLFMAYIFIPKMDRFMGKISIADAMGDLYGRNIRIIVALAGIIGTVGFIAVQFKVFGSVISYFLDIPAYQGIVVSAMIVTIYSAFGGIRAVTFTDILQIFAFGIAIPIIGVMIWNHAHFNGFVFIEAIKHPKFNPITLFASDKLELFSTIALMLYFAVPMFKQTDFQRISMGRDIAQAKSAFLAAASLIFLIPLAVQWLGFLIFSTNPSLDSKDLFGYIIENYTYIGLRGLMIAGVIAMVMSTADSHINASSVLFSHDICRPLHVSKKYELFISKIFALTLGVGGIILACYSTNLLKIILITNSFYMPIVTVPIMVTILGFRTSSLIISIGMASGFCFTLIWKTLGIKADGIFFAMITNLLFLLGSHYLLRQKGGWIKKQRPSKAKPKSNGPSLLQRIRNFDYVEYCRKKSPNNELSYVGLGIHIILFTVTTMYSIEAQFNTLKHDIVLGLYQIMMVTGVAFCTYPIWPAKYNEAFLSKALWPISIFTILVLFNTFLIMAGSGTQLQFAMFTINLLITAMLLGWKLGVPLIVIGIISMRILYYQLGLSDTHHPEFEPPASLVIYTLMIIWSIVMLFIKPQEDTITTQKDEIYNLEGKVTDLNVTVTHYEEKIGYQAQEIDRLGSTSQKILDNVNHELRLPVGNVVNFAEMLDNELSQYDSEKLKVLSKEVHKNSTRLSSMILNMLDLATLNAEKIELNKSVVNFSELVKDRIHTCRKIYLKNPKLDLSMKIQKNVFVNVDPNYIRQTVDNLIINAINFTKSGTIKISTLIDEKDEKVVFTIEDSGIGIPESDIYDIFTPFKIGSLTESKAEGRGVGLALCKSAIEAHGGKIEVESPEGKGARFIFTLDIVK